MAKSNNELLDKVKANTVPAQSNEPRTVADQVAQYLERPDMKKQLMAAVPTHMTPERMARTCLTAIRQTPALMECTASSLIACTIEAAQLGVEPGPLGHGYFVPFNRNVAAKGQPAKWVKEAKLIIGYRGLLDLMRRTGDIVTVGAFPIYSNDKFRLVRGFDEELMHEPAVEDRGKLIAFFAYATTKDGGRYADFMTLTEVDKIRSGSKAKDDKAWTDHYEEMGRKTVLRRLAKYLPMSVEYADRNDTDVQREFGTETVELNLGTLPSSTVEQPQGQLDAPFTQDEIAKIQRDEWEAETARLDAERGNTAAAPITIG